MGKVFKWVNCVYVFVIHIVLSLNCGRVDNKFENEIK